ncbi:MAG: glycerol-3-phosphate dehydrogenase/oxidase [Planctomycetes bacterium]|nr:glycerol-3-phosphate dehydrogenase/oxidase [Planctomycetota bacterium]
MNPPDPRTDRQDRLRRLREHRFDLLILGGGVTGAGIARDAALRGLSVALVEKADLANGTSSASSKLIHGGLRYLEQFELALVFEGTRERATLMRLAPHFARPLPFLFPVYESSRVGLLMVALGMWAYDLLAMFRNYRRHRMLSKGRTTKAEPGLLSKGLKGAALYYDCMTNDGRLTLETAIDAEANGAVVATYVEALEILRDSTGSARGLRVQDVLSPEQEPFEVSAKITIVAAGPWTDEILQRLDGKQPKRLRPTKGSHVVLDRAQLPVNHAVVLTGPTDGRVMFAIPWGARTILGTTDTDEEAGPDGLEASRADVEYLLEAARSYFPALTATPDDVISTWSGLRPLMGTTEEESESEVSREHSILSLDPGLLAIVGGKLTTYRLMAEQAVDRALEKLGTGVSLDPCRTHKVPLPGARLGGHRLRDLPSFSRELAKEHALDAEVAWHLTTTYGVRSRAVLAAGRAHGVRPGRLVPDLPYLFDEVVFAVDYELANCLDDVLRRRTLIFLQDRDQGLGVCEEVADLMAGPLGWSDERRAAEITRYRARVAASRAYREPASTLENAPEKRRRKGK